MTDSKSTADKAAEDRTKDAEDKAAARTESDRKAAERYDRERPEFDSYAEIARVRASVMAAPPTGSDPDSKQRIAKELQARGIELPDGYTVDPVTDEDRTVHTESSNEDYDKYVKEHEDARDTAHEEVFESKDEASSEGRNPKATAASKRAAANTSTTATPQGRSTAPQATGAEGK